MQDNIQREILLKLLKTDDYIISKDLAFSLNVSEKTVLKYLNVLKSELKDNGAELEVKHGSGSRLVITNQNLFNAYMEDGSRPDIPDTKEGRRSYVLFRLLSTQEYINIYDLADELYISPSLLRLTIKDLKSTLDNYQLSIDHSHSHGYRISGKENDIRRCLMKECDVEENIEYDQYLKVMKTDLLLQISSIMRSTLEQYGIAVSDDTVNALSLHTLVAINRMETANPIDIDEEVFKKLQPTPEFYVFSAVEKQLKEQLNLSLPKEEIAYLTLHLNGKQRLYWHESIQVQVSDDALVFYNRFLRNIYKINNVDFFSDEELRISLINHIVPFITRINSNLQITKSALSNIKNEFPYAYDLAVSGLSFLNDQGLSVSGAEISYFALHLALSIEKNRHTETTYNIAVVCVEISSLYQMMSYKLNKGLGSMVSAIKFFSLNDIRNIDPEDLNLFHLVLNTTDETFHVSIPVLHVSSFITDSDIETIRNTLKSISIREDLSALIPRELFINMEGPLSKQEIIQKQIKTAALHYQLDEDFYDNVMKRENLESTEYDNRIAIPHPLKHSSASEFICVARLDKPVLWNTQKVQLVFLLCMRSQEKISAFMDKISVLISNEEISQQLIQQENYDGFIETLGYI